MNLKYKDEDFLGKEFDRLKVTGPIEIVYKPNGKRERKVWCDCSCGNRALLSIIRIMNGECRSCGCLMRENMMKLGEGRKNGIIKSTGNYKHGGKGTRLYSIWKNMNNRCKYESCDNYKWYGGKGIKVCPEWNSDNPHGFENFRIYAYINGYDDTKDIDRIDSSKDYSPDNCRFVSHEFNLNNRSCNVNITYGGETFKASQWSEMIGIDLKMLYQRKKNGWNDSDALSIPKLENGEGIDSYKRENKAVKPFIFVDKDIYNKIISERDSNQNNNGGYTYTPKF